MILGVLLAAVVRGDAASIPGWFELAMDPSKGLVLQISPMAAHLTQRAGHPQSHHSAGRSPPKNFHHDRTPRDAYLAGR